MKKAILIIILLIGGLVLLINQDINQAKEVSEFIYENEVHKNFCEIAESREASREYLESNDCI